MAKNDLDKNAELLKRVAERFKALSDETRLRIMLVLRQGECNVNTIAASLKVAQPSVSKHLAVLRQAGLVDVRHEGVQSFFFTKDGSIYDMCDLVCGGVMKHLKEEFAALGLGQKGHSRPR